MRRLFIESPAFTAMVRAERIPDDLLRRLQNDIIVGGGEVIPGTGGIRKIRWADKAGGKRGGRRVLFADYEVPGVTVLLAAYAKNVQENISAAETNEWKRLKARLDTLVRGKYGR